MSFATGPIQKLASRATADTIILQGASDKRPQLAGIGMTVPGRGAGVVMPLDSGHFRQGVR